MRNLEDIKFRAKRIDTGEWIYGDLHLLAIKPHIHDKDFMKTHIDKTTVGQFTGLHDKNGKEIYEGDILEGNNMTGVRRAIVLFVQEAASFMIRYESRDTPTAIFNSSWFEYVDSPRCEVVGNIHEQN